MTGKISEKSGAIFYIEIEIQNDSVCGIRLTYWYHNEKSKLKSIKMLS